MASYKRIAAGNISTLAEWEMWTGTAWIAAVALPSAADTAYTNGYNTVIDTNWTVTEISNLAFQGTTATGRFDILAAGITFSGFRRCTTLTVLFISFGSGTSTVLGQGAVTSGTNILINGLANGILNLENAGVSSALYGIGTTMAGTGNAFKVICTTTSGGTNTYTYGISMTGSNYQLQLQGITQGSSGSGSIGVLNTGASNTIVNNGIIKGCDSNFNHNIGVWDTGSNTIFINNGIIQASTFSRGFQSNFAAGNTLSPTTTQSTCLFYAGGTLIDTAQYNAVQHPVWRLPEAIDGDLAWTLRTATTNRIMYTAGLLTGYPLVANVETGTIYGPSSEFTGTLNPVTVNVTVDTNAIASAISTSLETSLPPLLAPPLATDLLAEISTSADPLAERLRNASTVQTTGAQLQSLVIAP